MKFREKFNLLFSFKRYHGLQSTLEEAWIACENHYESQRCSNCACLNSCKKFIALHNLKHLFEEDFSCKFWREKESK